MIRAAATLALLFLNVLLWGTPILLVGLIKLLMPTRQSRTRVIRTLTELADRWAGGNNRILDWMLAVRWDVEGLPPPSLDGHYLIFSNHVSWVDILVLFRVFHRRLPFVRFFVKQQVIWLPIVGQACWALEFPFMKRYNADDLARHPEKRGQDLLTTHRACRRYRRIPVAVANFLEGTRFTRQKHADQESPYRHLLRPRVGGAAFAVAALGDVLDGIVDVTLAYPGSDVSLWDYLCGRIATIYVRVRAVTVPPEFLTEPITEPGPARDRFKSWIEQVWLEKDALLEFVNRQPLKPLEPPR